MLVVTIKTTILSEKQKEFIQTYRAVTDLLRKERGCRSCMMVRDMEDESVFTLSEEWETLEDLDRLVRSDHFRILIAAVNILGEEKEVKLNAVSYSAGMGDMRSAKENAGVPFKMKLAELRNRIGGYVPSGRDK